MRFLAVAAFAAVAFSCASAHAPMQSPALEPMRFEAPTPKVLDHDAFARDTPTGISESELHAVLDAPVFLAPKARVGVVPVFRNHDVRESGTAEGTPNALVEALNASNLVELASEISSEWVAGSGVAGLRELAARYRVDYLVLYRARHDVQTHKNPWAWGYATILGALFFPGETVEAAGVLEATFFDVKTGTILFTSLERFHGETNAAPPGETERTSVLVRELYEKSAPKLGARIIDQCQRLVAARPQGLGSEGTAQGVSGSSASPGSR